MGQGQPIIPKVEIGDVVWGVSVRFLLETADCVQCALNCPYNCVRDPAGGRWQRERNVREYFITQQRITLVTINVKKESTDIFYKYVGGTFIEIYPSKEEAESAIEPLVLNFNKSIDPRVERFIIGKVE